MRRIFKEAVFLSLVGHAAVFGTVSLSFGPELRPLNFTDVSFRGSFLAQRELSPESYAARTAVGRLPMLGLGYLRRKAALPVSGLEHYLKPEAFLAQGNKLFWQPAVQPLLPVNTTGDKSVVMLYPALSFNPSLYFKDRRQVHLELVYRGKRSGSDNYSVFLKRRISSGNLEADLLSMRSLSRYLLIRQSETDSGWHTVKIELSPGINDQF